MVLHEGTPAGDLVLYNGANPVVGTQSVWYDGTNYWSEDNGTHYLSEDNGTEHLSTDNGTNHGSEDKGTNYLSEDNGTNYSAEDNGTNYLAEDNGTTYNCSTETHTQIAPTSLFLTYNISKNGLKGRIVAKLS